MLQLFNKTVLIIDDEAFSRATMKQAATSLQAQEVLEADDGVTAMEFINLNGENIDVIISDYRMPGLDGLNLLARLRTGQLPLSWDLPFIMLTGHNDMPLVRSAASFGVDGFFTKPVAAKTMAQRIERLFGQDRVIRDIDYYNQLPVPSMADLGIQVYENRSEQARHARDEQQSPPQPPATTRLGIKDIPVGATLAEDLKDENGLLLLLKGETLGAAVLEYLQDTHGDDSRQFQVILPE